MSSKLCRILICFFVLGNIPEGFVICYGANGHIALKAASHRPSLDCSHDIPQDYTQQTVTESNDHSNYKHSQPCIDIPVLAGFISRFSNANPEIPTSTFVAINTISGDIRTQNFESENPLQPPGRENQQLHALSSVILLT